MLITYNMEIVSYRMTYNYTKLFYTYIQYTNPLFLLSNTNNQISIQNEFHANSTLFIQCPSHSHFHPFIQYCELLFHIFFLQRAQQRHSKSLNIHYYVVEKLMILLYQGHCTSIYGTQVTVDIACGHS